MELDQQTVVGLRQPDRAEHYATSGARGHRSNELFRFRFHARHFLDGVSGIEQRGDYRRVDFLDCVLVERDDQHGDSFCYDERIQRDGFNGFDLWDYSSLNGTSVSKHEHFVSHDFHSIAIGWNADFHRAGEGSHQCFERDGKHCIAVRADPDFYRSCLGELQRIFGKHLDGFVVGWNASIYGTRAGSDEPFVGHHLYSIGVRQHSGFNRACLGEYEPEFGHYQHSKYIRNRRYGFRARLQCVGKHRQRLRRHSCLDKHVRNRCHKPDSKPERKHVAGQVQLVLSGNGESLHFGDDHYGREQPVYRDGNGSLRSVLMRGWWDYGAIPPRIDFHAGIVRQEDRRHDFHDHDFEPSLDGYFRRGLDCGARISVGYEGVYQSSHRTMGAA